MRLIGPAARPETSSNFPSFWEGLSLRLLAHPRFRRDHLKHFPSFWEGLSLRLRHDLVNPVARVQFPFLFGRAFIEANPDEAAATLALRISLPFGRAFIEAYLAGILARHVRNFPSCSEGLSLRRSCCLWQGWRVCNFPSYLEGLSLRIQYRRSV